MNSKFESLIEASPMPTAIYTGLDMIIEVANTEMIQLWGKDHSVIGKPLLAALPELKDQGFLEILQQVYISGETFHSKEARVDLVVDGMLQKFYFTFTYKALRNEKGEVYAIINTAAHLTELILAREQIIETEERLKFSLQSAGIGTWNLDPIRNTVEWDIRCRVLFGFPQNGEVLYQDVLNCIHPDDKNSVDQAVKMAIDPENEGIYDIKYRTVSSVDGVVRWVHCKGRAYFNARGVAFRFAGIAQDISEEIRSRRSERQLLTLVNNNTDHMTVAKMNGELIYMNQASRQMLGVQPDADVSRLNAQQFYSPEEYHRVQQEVLRNLNEENGWQGYFKLKNIQSNEEIPCWVSYLLIKDPTTGEVIGRGTTARDLRAEIKAKAQLEQMAAIISSSEDFCNYCDIEGHTQYINPSGIMLIGIEKTEIFGKSIFDYHSTEANKRIKDEIFPVLFEKGRWSGELELIHQHTGEIIPIHKQFYMIREELTNVPVAIAGIARDLRPELSIRNILNQKNATLQNVVDELEFLADTVPSIVWTSKPNGQIDYINKRWYDQSGRPQLEIINTLWTETVHPDDREKAKKIWNKALNSGEPYETEFRCLDREGVYRWFLVRALPLKNADNEIVKWYGTNTDIHHQKELERQKDNFLGIASHELKTPVTSLKAYAQVLESIFIKSGDLKNADLLSKMNKQVDRLTNLITDLLDVTKITSGKLSFDRQNFDFNEMLNEVIEDMSRLSATHSIVQEIGFYGTINGDRDRICQVLTNLIANAIKYSPKADQIIIKANARDNGVEILVEDFGIGINRNLKDHVFEQFYRVNETKQHTFPGLGLGLYISAEIVKRLDGMIWVDSVEGEGSVFGFWLPIQTLENDQFTRPKQ
ncbi:PAS domain S-box protein [Pedobacter sp. AW1-32]|uniref:PAS domain S-box protein n=1 Tax=Pedobacter sp. AW1-32 TaxID=3383026 RepID=UPI003FEE86B0